jgi:hypothetical protein
LGRIADLSRFTKELKERFTKWYNHRKDRCGTLWQGRFRSVLVESDGEDRYGWLAMQTIAAYIDLNPVRAVIVAAPGDYKWSGYGAALRGSKRAKRGLNYLMRSRIDSWEEDLTGERYMRWMELQCGKFGDSGEEHEANATKQVDSSKSNQSQIRTMEAEIELNENSDDLHDKPAMADGLTARNELERLREGPVPSFSRGLAVGRLAFVEAIFLANPQHFSANRQQVAKAIRYPSRGKQKILTHEIFALRDVRREDEEGAQI